MPGRFAGIDTLFIRARVFFSLHGRYETKRVLDFRLHSFVQRDTKQQPSDGNYSLSQHGFGRDADIRLRSLCGPSRLASRAQDVRRQIGSDAQRGRNRRLQQLHGSDRDQSSLGAGWPYPGSMDLL